MPTDIGEQMKNQHERTRFRDAISNLGFPSLDHPEVPDSRPTETLKTTLRTSTITPTFIDLDIDDESHKILHPKQARNWEEELTSTMITTRR